MTTEQQQLSKELGQYVPELLEHSLTVIVKSKIKSTPLIDVLAFMGGVSKEDKSIPVIEWSRWTLEGIGSLSDEELGKLVRHTINKALHKR